MFFFDLIGTIAFAIAGALTGVQKKLDIFGVTILALTTALGGGVARDVIISNTPPMALRNYDFVLISIVSALMVFMVHHYVIRYNMLIQVCDAIGLGAFAVAGANIAVQFGQNNLLVIIFLAVVTGVGGGVIRDVFVQEIPSIFCKEIYAVAALVGGACYYFIYPYGGETAAMYVCFIVTTAMRLIAMKYNMNLPRIEK